MPYMPTTQLTNPAGAGMVLIADTLLAVTATSFDFQSIPQTYKHLRLIAYWRTDKAASVFDTLRLRFNNDSGGNYYNQRQIANTTTNTADFETGETGGILQANGSSSPANAFTACMVEIPNYAGAVGYTTYLATYGNYKDTNSPELIDASGTWLNTAAVTRITIVPAVGPNFIVGSRATLYGLT